MTSFTFKKVTKPAAELGGESSLPALDTIPLKPKKRSAGYDETRGLFLGYGFVHSSFPHRAQNNYTRALHDKELDAVILENDFLRAEFIPSMGGKLWSLYDKKAKRDILFNNPVVRYCNLATRNAWTSGGVEFNIGEFGHHAYTCSTLFTAKTELDDGTPVLRMYEYSRIRSLVYQMDFWLPDESPMLFCRMRVVNPNDEVKPMYWWSNAAVPDWAGRVIVPSHEAYAYDYTSSLCLVPIPYHHGADMSYNKNNPCSDTFYDIPDDKRRYICYADRNGYAYAHTSTKRLKSRKMFVWGNGNGGKRWQQFLSGNGNPGSYIELQAGIANTQSEHIPMPPKTAWEWVETYGALSLDPEAVHGDYGAAASEAEKQLELVVGAERLEEILTETKNMALAPAKEMLLFGSGWGALENERRKKEGEPDICPHLDFGTTCEAQKQWSMLLQKGTMGMHDADSVPPSWMNQPEWVEMMEAASENADHDNWYTHLQLGCAYYSLRDFRLARQSLERSLSLRTNCWALYALSCMDKMQGDVKESAEKILHAANLNPEDISLASAAVRILHEANMTDEIIDFIRAGDNSLMSNSRIRMYYAYALLHSGKVEAAEIELNRDGGIEIADIREAEISITDLWLDIEQAKAERDGKTFDRKTAVPPIQFDFRMTLS